MTRIGSSECGLVGDSRETWQQPANLTVCADHMKCRAEKGLRRSRNNIDAYVFNLGGLRTGINH